MDARGLGMILLHGWSLHRGLLLHYVHCRYAPQRSRYRRRALHDGALPLILDALRCVPWGGCGPRTRQRRARY